MYSKGIYMYIITGVFLNVKLKKILKSIIRSVMVCDGKWFFQQIFVFFITDPRW